MTVLIMRKSQARFSPALQEMHRDRKRIFVDRLRWDVPVVQGDFEIDQFDTDSALYVIAIDPGTQHHLGSVRLLPTTEPHLLDTVFPELCDGPPPVGPDIWEITRLCTAPGLDRDHAAAIRGQLTVAMVETALAHGVRHLTAVCHMQFLSRVLAVGWECEPLGLPQEIEGQQVGAAIIHIKPATVQLLRARYGMREAA